MKEKLTLGVVVLLLLGVWGAKCGHRPSMLPLATSTDGPAPERANQVLVMLHGSGGSISTTDWIVDELRHRGLGKDTSVVMVNGPFSALTGRGWGETDEEQRESVSRVRKLIASWRARQPQLRVVMAGFSRGADLAEQVATHDASVTGLVVMSGCAFEDLETLAERDDVVVTVAHGLDDQLCSFANSVALVSALTKRGREVDFVQHRENHTIPPVALDAIVRALERR